MRMNAMRSLREREQERGIVGLAARRYRRFWLGLTAVLAAPSVLRAETTVEWEVTRDVAAEHDGALLVVPDAHGAVFVIGATALFSGGENIAIVKYDGAGVEQWMQTFSGLTPNSYDYPVDAVVDAAGDLYVVAQTQAESVNIGVEWITLKFAGSDGAPLWEQRYHGTGTFGGPLPRDMTITAAGEIVVTGWARDDAAWVDLGVVKYSADGAELWARQLSSPGFHADAAEAVAVGPGGEVAIVGQYVDSGDRVVATAKYGADGALQWVATYDASAMADLEDRVQSVAIDADGAIYVGADGIDNSTDGRDHVLLKYSPAGALLWDARVVEPTSDLTPKVLLGDDGVVYLSGASDGAYRLTAFDTDGLELWTFRRSGTVQSETARDHAVIDSDGNVAVLLRTLDVPGITALTVARYASDGTLVDETVTKPAGVTQFPGGLASDGSGNLYVTGWWSPNGNRDFLTFKLSLGSAPRPGDLNGDGAVDLADLSLMLAAFGACEGDPRYLPEADLDGSQCIELADLGVLLANYGS